VGCERRQITPLVHDLADQVRAHDVSCRNPRARSVLSVGTRCNVCRALDTNVHVCFRQSPLAAPVEDGAVMWTANVGKSRTAARDGAITLAASVGKIARRRIKTKLRERSEHQPQRRAVWRRSEPRRFFSANADDVGAYKARLREQQAQKNCASSKAKQ
jgi:hypothetical protein